MSATTNDAATTVVAVRSPSDVLRLVVAGACLLIALIVGRVGGRGIVQFVADVFDGLDHLPVGLVTGVVGLGQLLGLTLLVGGVVVAVRRGEWRLLLSVAVAAVVGPLLAAACDPLLGPAAGQLVEVASWLPVDPTSDSTDAGLASVLAITTVVSAWVGRRWRRLWWTAAVFSVLAHLLAAPVSFESVVAVLGGWVAGAAVVVVAGAPSRRPTRDAVVEGLSAAGLDVAHLEPASVDARGSTPYFGATVTGDAIFAKTLGADERSADLMFRLYRRLQPRDLHDERPFSSLRRAVEHEALVALAARDVGVRTPRVLAVATAHPNGFTLAYQAVAGGSLDRQAPADVTDDVLGQVWDQLAVLRQHRIAHRDLRLANVFLDDRGDAWLIDFGFSELAVDDTLLAADVAELLASSSTVVGAERAVAVALDRLGPDAVASAGPRLRPALLSGATRSALKAEPQLLVDLQAASSREGAGGRRPPG